MILKHPHFQAYSGIHIAGIEGKQFDIEIQNGRFTSVKEAEPQHVQAEQPQQKLWISPGIIDLHTHLAWTDFDHADQLNRDSREVEVMQAEAFAATLRTGVTTARDAGGILPSTIRHLVKYYQRDRYGCRPAVKCWAQRMPRGLSIWRAAWQISTLPEQAGSKSWQQEDLVHLPRR